MHLSGNPLVCDCEMRWYRRWYNDGWQVSCKLDEIYLVTIQKYLTDRRQDVDEDHIRDTDCTDPVDGREHNIAKVGHVSPIATCAHVPVLTGGPEPHVLRQGGPQRVRRPHPRPGLLCPRCGGFARVFIRL